MFEDLIEELQPFARELVDAAGRAGLLPRVTSTRRSHALQKKLYDRFLAGAAQYPVLPPGLSAHEFGYAFDMVVSPMEALEDVGYTWQQWGGLWGGRRDPVHFEYPGFVPPDTGLGYVSGLERFEKTTQSVAESLASPWWTFLLPEEVSKYTIPDVKAPTPGLRVIAYLESLFR